MLLCMGISTSANSTAGMDLLNEIIDSERPSQLCPYIECQEPVPKDKCPEGTIYMEKVAQFGCCGACVQFLQTNSTDCTGSIDSGGYSVDQNDTLPSDFIIKGHSPCNHGNTLCSSWCDYGLTCNETVCVHNDGGLLEGAANSMCKYVREAYDDAVSSGTYISFRDDYRWKPECTPEGYYAEKQCKGPIGEQRCVCVDPDGNSIYGRVIPQLQPELYQNMTCKCSRKVWELNQQEDDEIGLLTTLHCTENGNYEPLQCDRGWCYCIDPLTAIRYGLTLPETGMKKLFCYNSTKIGAQYLRRCESELQARAVLYDTMEAHGTTGVSPFLKCDPDGSYSDTQFFDSNFECFDKYNEQILPVVPSPRGCNCARDHWLFDEIGLPFPYTCRDKYDSDVLAGVYWEKQTIGNAAFCVDEDGARSGPAVKMEYVDLLDCSASSACQAGNNNMCEHACRGCLDDFYIKYKLPQNSHSPFQFGTE